MRYRPTLITTCLLVFLFSCTDKKEEFLTESLSDYLPLQPGKYITYRIDSLVFTNFERDVETHSYQVKHIVDAEIKDNLGRSSYRIYRSLRNADGTGEWVNNGAYYATPLPDRIEVMEDNQRFIKLHAPLREGYNWEGNKYLHSDPYPSIGIAPGYLENWDYYYDSFNSSIEYNGYEYKDVWTVEEKDVSQNFPVADTARHHHGEKYRGVEKYAKNVGLVYREFYLVDYQPNTSGPNPYYKGFGITMWMIDHN
ncbi:MAG TPA: hypothetical protein VJ111_06280 [Chitinophagaceae bacterium]|nr:hypothetical protein [Chitinophagaceae bacterium]